MSARSTCWIMCAGKRTRHRLSFGDRLDTGAFSLPVRGSEPVTRRCNLKIQDGCDSYCSYCVVPFVRGPSRSRCLENLVEEAERLTSRGAREIVLTGVNIGNYDHEGRNVVDVVDRLNAIPGLARVRVSSIELVGIPEGLFERMDDPHHALVPFLHIPLQSGSDTVLARMNRRYTAADFLSFTAKARESVRDVCVGTDVLVGMPGESREEFEDTCRVIEESPVAYAHVFAYSPRPGTAAEGFPDRVDPRTAHDRSVAVRRLSETKWGAFRDKYLGKTCAVLFESRTRGRWTGYTGNYVRVGVCCDDELTNNLRQVVLDRREGEWVLGRLADE